jgi:hypothetical protein
MTNKTGNVSINATMVARSCNHCCGRIPVSITYCERVFVALGLKHKVRKFPFYARDLSFSTHSFPNSISYPLSSQEIRHIDFLTSVFGCKTHKKVHNK